MLRRSAFGLMASGGVLFLAGASGLMAAWSVVVGTLLLTAASMLLAVALEARDVEPWPPATLKPPVDLHRLERAG